MSGFNNEKWNGMSAALLHKNTSPTTTATARNTLLRRAAENITCYKQSFNAGPTEIYLRGRSVMICVVKSLSSSSKVIILIIVRVAKSV